MSDTDERQLATIEVITEIAPIPDADAIVRARVRGWDVVVKKDEFQVGNRCVYFEIDSWMPLVDDRFAFLAPRGMKAREDGADGHVLKTARLRGQYSQGLALPITEFPELEHVPVGGDVTTALGVTLWEPPIPAELAEAVIGPRPSWIPVTREDRLQNIPAILQAGGHWIATEKVDGESCTAYQSLDEDENSHGGVCSRGWDYKDTGNDRLWDIVKELKLHARMQETWPGMRVALQGELFGPGVRKNPLQLKEKQFLIFTVRLGISELPRDEWPLWVQQLAVPARPELKFPVTVDQAFADIDSLQSVIAPGRPAEGVVWRRYDATSVVIPDGPVLRASFKAVSNRYLLKHDRD